MKLLKIFDKRDTKIGYQEIIYRNAARAIILKGHEILLVFSETANEYKFPGGGIDKDETRQEALKREVLEEVGREVMSVNECLGYTDQIYNDIYDTHKYFYQRSYYYFCEITDEYHGLKLSESERALRFLPKWVDINEAIQVNKDKIASGNAFPWTERELFVMELLKGMIQ